MANAAITITLTIVVLINTAQSLYIIPNPETGCIGIKPGKCNNILFSKVNDQQISDLLLELESVDVDIPNRIDDAQLKSQHNSKLVGTAAADTRTSTTSYIDD
ncbi:hypothetical protein QTP88_004235 [Uroleucon formosanum]